jgi:P4 family phage/plasmid primase-like protien
MENLDAINKELEEMGVGGVTDSCPERTRYIVHLDEQNWSDKDWIALLKELQNAYFVAFYKYFAAQNPYLLYEIGEDKIYWNYNDDNGVYDEFKFTTVRGFVIKLLISEGFEAKATEPSAKMVLNKYRSMYEERGRRYDEFDSNGDWFHAKNGWVNVQTLKFKQHSPEMLSRRVSAVAYDKNANCKNYDHFLDTQMQLKKDQIAVIDQFSGLLLTPDITHQKMLVLVGKPGCGKSTLMDCWSDILGDCSKQMPLSKISNDSFSRFGGSSIAGKQSLWFDEVEVTRSKMGSDLINLISGQTIGIERKGIDGTTDVQNQLKCILSANSLPKSAEAGIYRRMILINLEYSFYDNMTANKNIRQMLADEASGVLNRMLKGLAQLNKHGGFTMIAGHDDLIEDYKASSNTMSEFLDHHFTYDENATPITSKVLLEAYQNFAHDRYSESLTPQRFGMLLKNHGLSKFSRIESKHDASGKKVWHGLQLKSEMMTNVAGYIREK